MSKSKGNVIDPLEFMDKYGSDALRFSLARGANPGADQALAEEWIGGARNFATKLWNATRFALMNGATVEGPLPAFDSLNAIDRWILSRLNETIAEADQLLESYEFAKASELIYHFAWDDLCDWYLELSKDAFQKGDAASTKRVLGHVLDQLLRLMHPIMPFISEELWVTLTSQESLVIAEWPKADTKSIDKSAEKIVMQLQDVITEVRRFRNDQGIKTSQKIPGRLVVPAELQPYVAGAEFLLKLEPGSFTPSAKLEIGNIKAEFDLTGSIDVAAERARLTKDLATAEKDRATATAKLGNEGFMAKAPENVVAEIRERLAKCDSEIERIKVQLASLPS
jgi:valyl-tRNA synthetase